MEVTVGLAESSRGYLSAGPWTVAREGEGFVEYRADGRALLVWADESVRPARGAMTAAEREHVDEQERRWLASFRDAMGGAAMGTAGIFLTSSRLGLSSSFTSEAREVLSSAGGDGGVRVPVEFFDTDYRSDGTDRVSAMRRVFASARRTRRVPQPWVRGGEPGGDDVVEDLVAELTDGSERARLRIIDGSAGGGKTVAFNALALRLHEAFVAAKGRGARGVRPIAFTERQLRSRSTDGQRRVDDLIDTAITTELAEPVTREQFEWLLVNGHTLWMFDGLDEIYSGGSAFFERVAGLLDAPGSTAQIVLCTRDSLLTSNRHLGSFVRSSQASGRDVAVVELSPWGEAAWRQLAWIRLEDERESARNSPRIEALVQQIRSSPVLRQLMGLPFYCDEILAMADEDKLAIHSDFDVLGIIVDRMLEREFDKDLFDWPDFASALDATGHVDPAEVELGSILAALRSAGRNALIDILESLAHARQRFGDDEPQTLPLQLVRNLASMRSGIDPQTVDGRDAMLAIIQFAFFGAGESEDTVVFSHPIVADFLAARHAVQRIRECDGDHYVISRAIGPLTVPPGSVFVRYLRHALQIDAGFRRAIDDARAVDEASPLQTFLGLLVRSRPPGVAGLPE